MEFSTQCDLDKVLYEVIKKGLPKEMDVSLINDNELLISDPATKGRYLLEISRLGDLED